MNHRSRIRVIAILLIISGIISLYALEVGLDVKLFWAYMSTAITVAGYAIYISQMYPSNGENAVKPEPYSWVLFGLFTATGAFVQIAQGGRTGSWCLVVTACMCFLIAGWSYWRWKSDWPFDLARKIYVGVAIALFVLSVFKAHEPGWAIFSAVSATLADVAGYGPTFMKAWSHPDEDSVTNFVFNSLKCVPALLALQAYSVATTVYLVMLTIVNGGFVLFLLFRRYQLRENGTSQARGGSDRQTDRGAYHRR